MLGIAPLALLAAKYLPNPAFMGVDFATGPDTTVIACWQPCTAYHAGQKIIVSGMSEKYNGEWVVVSSGVTGSLPRPYGPLRDSATFNEGTLQMEKL